MNGRKNKAWLDNSAEISEPTWLLFQEWKTKDETAKTYAGIDGPNLLACSAHSGRLHRIRCAALASEN